VAEIDVAQFAFVSGVMLLAGAAVFDVGVTPGAGARLPLLSWWMWGLLALAMAGLTGWAVRETVSMAGAATWVDLRTVLGQTMFGHVALSQAVLLAATGACLASGARTATMVAAMACVALQAAHGHAMAMGGAGGFLVWTDVLHLLAGSVWVGGLVPLLLVVWRGGAPAGAMAARGFSRLGRWAVWGVAGSALVQGAWLVGSVRALVASGYGRMVLVKAALFAALLAFALLNRYRLAPGLRGPAPGSARRRLLASIALQSVVGLAAIGAAVVLGGLSPGFAMGGS
jgi:putative copper resistance protein D